MQRVYTRIGGAVLDVKALAEGSDGAIWSGALAGLVRLPPGGRPAGLRILTRAQGLIDNTVPALAADRAGNIWAGTPGAGAMKIQPAGFTTFREQDGLGVRSGVRGSGGSRRRSSSRYSAPNTQ